MSAIDNVDLDEIDKFNELAHRWWDTDGDFKPLHDINPVASAISKKEPISPAVRC